MRGVFALALTLASILALLSLSSGFFSLERVSKGFLDYRRAAYQSYLRHDFEYSLHRIFEAIRSSCRALALAGHPEDCSSTANAIYSSLILQWRAQGFSISGGGVSAVVLPDNVVDVRLVSDILWRKGDYSGRIPAGYGG